ncbi:MAG: tetratricopeptide repeat protein [Deltaproteobacteria bacterium]|nr:tetratricopeptide repeat protein [Deltaproteobacteria bacterium]MCW8892721.1 tetratricopeptide repeat protein [Deltaproteobacteria bacterium]MCW9049087.1 tetratricopeptide repeat protein [Deltaproteobacteria bacterium]
MDPAENNVPQDSTPPQPSVIDLSKKARQKLRSRRFDEAQVLFSAGLEMEPENPYLLSGMGDVCREMGDFDEAKRCYKLLLEVDRKNLFALRGLGDVYKKLNRHQEAILLWEQYLALRPQDKHVMTRIADSYKVMQQFDRAEQAYQQILVIAPRDRFALTGLADLQHRLGKDEEAIRTYERVLVFDENELHILTIVGKLCWRISDFDRAEKYFRRALKIEPQNPYALYGLGNCFRWSQEYAKAIEVWQEILKSSAGTQALHTRMGDAYFNLGRMPEAEISYQKALTFGEDVFSTAGLICLYSERQKWDDAARVFWMLMSDDADALMRLELLTKRFLRSGQRQSMLGLFEYLLSAGGENRRVLDQIGEQINSLV